MLVKRRHLNIFFLSSIMWLVLDELGHESQPNVARLLSAEVCNDVLIRERIDTDIHKCYDLIPLLSSTHNKEKDMKEDPSLRNHQKRLYYATSCCPVNIFMFFKSGQVKNDKINK